MAPEHHLTPPHRRWTEGGAAAKGRGRLATIGLAAVPLVILGFAAWEGSLVSGDDVIFGFMAKEMAHGGSLLDLRLFGEVLHQRPPLAVWLMALSGWLGGFSELSLRLPCILSAWLAALAVGRIGTTLVSRRAGILAVVFLLGSELFYFNARRVMSDMPFLAFGLWAIAMAIPRGGGQGRPWLAGIFLGLAAMAKGMVVVVPLGVVAAAFVVFEGPALPKARRAIVAALAVAGPWHLVQIVRYGPAFIEEYVGYNLLARAASPLFLEQDSVFYLDTLVQWDGLSMALFAAALVVLVVTTYRRAAQGHGKAQLGVSLFLVLWLLGAVLPFQLAATKIEHYILPAIPAMALIVGYAVERLLEWADARGPAGGRLALVLVTMVLVAVGLQNIGPALFSPDYSRDEKTFGLKVAAVMEEGTVVTALDCYTPAFFWYAGLQPRLTTTSEEAYAIMTASRELERTGSVSLLDKAALEALVVGDAPVAFLVPHGAPTLLDAVAEETGTPLWKTTGTRYDLVWKEAP